MPIYEYQCKNCGNIFEEWYKKISDATESVPCPKCAGEGLQIMSNTTFALKGEGWYVTEYGNKKTSASTSDAGAAATPAATYAKNTTEQASQGTTSNPPANSTPAKTA